jgi:cytochrome P450
MSGDRQPDPDPYPNLAWLRANAPVSRTEKGTAAAPIYFVTPFELVRSGLSDSRLTADPRKVADISPEQISFDRGLLDTDPPDHGRMRQVLHHAFAPSGVLKLRPMITKICRRAIHAFETRGHADLMAEYAQVVPVEIVHEILGVPPEVRVPAPELMDWYWRAGLSRQPDDDAMDQIDDYVRRILDHKRDHRGADLTTIMLDALARGDLHDEAELRGTLSAVLGPGHITTVPMLATGIVRLLERPAVLAAARGEPSRWADVVEEVLRYDSVVQVTNNRYAEAELTIGGVEVPKGSIVLMSLAAANRDPSRFDHPDTFDVDRRRRGHVAFGHGPHVCLGARLGRVEGEIAFATLFEALPSLRLACPPEEVVWTWGPTERGPATVPVTFAPREGEA